MTTTLETPQKPVEIACSNSKEKQSIVQRFKAGDTETAEPSKVFTTHRKHTHRKQSQKIGYSIANSMLKSIDSELDALDLFGGEMVHESFDCPVKLRSAYNAETKANGDSACQELRRFMANYVATSLVKKHALGNTMSKLVDAKFSIGSMNFTQNVQSRPRRLVRESGDSEASEGDGDGARCAEKGCSGVGVGFVVLKGNGKEYRFCEVHLREKKLDRANWRVP